MKKILITGASGFIGRRLVEKLKHKYNVYALSSHMKTIPGVTCIDIDFSEDWNEKKLPKEIDIIIHLAQSVHFREFPEYAKHVYYVNTLSTLKLLNFAIKNNTKKFIYTSSGGVYGYSNTAFSENELLKIDSELGFYLSSKLSSELLIENYQSILDVIILRPFFVYGPGQKQTMLIPRLVERVQKRLPIDLQGKNGISINPIYVKDAMDAIIKSISLKGSYKINIAGPQVLTLKKIVDIIGKNLHIAPVFSINTKVKPKSIIGDIDVMKKLIGAPSITFQEGIKSYLAKTK